MFALKPRSGAEVGSRAVVDWRVLLAVYWFTSLVEAMGMSQVFAFLPSLLRDMGVAETDRLQFVGLFNGLIFIVGAPLVPLWGVWADKYSRKAVIIRSALVEAVVAAAVGLSQEPWQLALSLLLIGFQLGNTGVMLAGIRDVVPGARLGTVIAFFGASGAIGSALGPILGGLIVDGLGLPFAAVFLVAAGFSLLTVLLLVFLTPDVRPEVVPTGSVVRLAFGAMRSVLTEPTTRRIFAIFGVAFLASQISRPFLPILVERLNVTGVNLASDIGLVVGTAALAGGLVSIAGGALGDRIGFRPVLVASLLGGGLALLAIPLAPTIPVLAATALLFAALNAGVGAMVFGLLATEVPPDRRSATLNLVYLPLYGAGIVGPALGSVIVTAGLPAPFFVGGGVLLVAGALLARGMIRRRQAGRSRSRGPV